MTAHVHYRDMDNWTMMVGTGLWFYVDESGRTVCYQKEGINAGVSGLIRHYPEQDISVVLLSNMEDGAWKPVWVIHDVVIAEGFE